MPVLIALVAGLIFGAGLTVSAMVSPAKVLAFLDVGGIAAGAWDPSLAFVMGGAIAVFAPAFLLTQRRGRAVLNGALRIPPRRPIDRPLVAGAILFGLGWGLVGFCPGPAVSALAFGATEAFVFFGAVIAGMLVYAWGAAPRFAAAGQSGV